MKKLSMHTLSLADRNYSLLSGLFPNAITETIDENGNLVRAIDADVLAQEINKRVVSGNEERYQFNWPDKKKSILLANASIAKTLRPCLEDSVDFDNTQNLYIEGDNLEVLKLLQETYLGKVKMIYIDPPYNTGNDFVYEDDFSQNANEYLANSGQFDEDGNRLVQNTESNGRFHTDWLNMIYPRIKLAKDILSDDGIIFISIDDNEYGNMQKILDELFGEKNSLVPFIWELPRGINAGHISKAHEYVIAYAKNKDHLNQFLKEIPVESVERCNKKIDSRHPASEITFPSGFPYEGKDQTITGVIEGSERVEIIGEMILKDGMLKEPVTLVAGWTMRRMIQDWIDGKKVFDLKGQEIKGFFIKENGKVYSKKEMIYDSPKSILKGLGDSQSARKELQKIFGTEDLFDYPKPTSMIEKLVKLVTKDNDIIMDFFSGSGSTAQAIMNANSKDGNKRRYILVQVDEKTKEGSVANEMGYKNICEIARKRIAACSSDIENIDSGFRTLKLDSTNMKDVYYNPEEFTPTLFDDITDNIKDDRTSLDLLFQVMLEMDVLLSSKIVETEICGKKLYSVMDDYMIACFDKEITSEVVEAIARKEPYYAIFRDSCMADDSTMASFEQIFETYSKETIRKVL